MFFLDTFLLLSFVIKIYQNHFPQRPLFVQVTLDHVKVPAKHIIGEENQGFKIALSGLDGGRINIGACRL